MTTVKPAACILFASLLVIGWSAIASAQQPQPSRIRGTVERVEGEMVQIKTRDGQDVTVHMAKEARVAGVAKIALSDVKVGWCYDNAGTERYASRSRGPSVSGSTARHR